MPTTNDFRAGILSYRDFYDVPRWFCVAVRGGLLVFDCSFDVELDDYVAHYEVKLLRGLSAENAQDGELVGGTAGSTASIGRVEVRRDLFDETRRRYVWVPRRIGSTDIVEPVPMNQPVKDEESAHPVPDAWRPTFCEIVKAFVRGDYALTSGVRFVASVDDRTARQMCDYVADYGETLAELTDDSWSTSISQWMRSHWDVLVDLRTVESGSSDMVLHARVVEHGDAFQIEIHALYVP